MQFKRLRLIADDLGAQRDFYEKTLGLPIAGDSADSITIQAGATAIEFVAAASGEGGPSGAFYHFAMNIPENRIQAARDWLTARCPVLPVNADGDEIVFFDRWNADSVYFSDPAGNIVELIARHTLKNAAARPFGAEHVSCASEIGIVAPRVADAVRTLEKSTPARAYLGLSRDEITAVGDERGMLIVVETAPWFPALDRKAAVFPTEITVGSGVRTPIVLDGLPYRIEGPGGADVGR